MRYELLLQSSVPGAPYQATRVHERLTARGVIVTPAGNAIWFMKSGTVELAPLLDGGRQVATEVRIPLTDKGELVREALGQAAEVASEADVRLYDPQLSKAVGASDVDDVLAQYWKTANYAAETLGEADAFLSANSTLAETQKKGWKIVLGVLAVLVLLYLLSDAAINRM